MKKVFAVLLSIVLVLSLILTCMVSYVTSLATNPDTVIRTMRATFENIDYEKLLADAYADNGDDVSAAEIARDAECVRQLIIESEVVTQSLEWYAADAADAFAGNNTAPRFSYANFRTLTDKYIDEMANIVHEADPETDPVMVKSSLKAYLDKNGPKLINDISPAKLIPANERKSISNVIELLSTVELILIVVALVLAGLIYLLRKYHFGGLLWLGVDAILAGGLLVGALSMVKDLLHNTLASNNVDPSLMDSVVSAMMSSLTTSGIILLVVGVVFIGGFIALKCTVVRKKQAANA